MPEILDVVHKLTYDANTNPLQEVDKVLGSQRQKLEELIRLNDALIAREKTLADQGVKNRTALNRQIDLNKQKIAQLSTEMGKQYVQNERLQKAVQRTAGQFNSLSFSLGNILRDLPYGFIGIANNIGPAFDDLQRKFRELQAQGKGTGALFREIGMSLFGFTGLVNIVITGIQLLGSQLGGLTKETADLTKAQEANIVVNQEAAGIYAKEAAELGLLADEVANTATSQERLQQIRKELVKDYPALASSLEGEENLNIRLFNAIQNVTEALKQQAIAKAALNLITKETERFLSNEIGNFNAFGIGIRNSFIMAFKGTAAFLNAAAADAQKQNQNQYDLTIRNLTNILRNAQSALNSTGLGKLIEPSEKEKKLRKDSGKSIEEIRKEIDELARSINRLDAQEYIDFLNDLDNDNKQKLKAIEDDLGRLAKSFTLGLFAQYDSPLTTNQSDTLNAQLQISQDQRAKQKKEEEFKRTEQKATIQAALEGYQTLANEVGNVFNEIYNRQLQTLDNQISITQDRISKAIELAKLGNTEVLQAEENRLDELQKKREEIAEKQLKVDAALRASSAAIAAAQAIQTVTNAGATGDPYTTAARIAAAVAALAAGFAFVSSLTQAFKDGVVDYQGKGTGTSDSNIVRISRGESVITAEATQQYKPILEAMNAGTFNPDRLMVQQNSNKFETKRLERKLDGVIEAINMSGSNVHIGANGDGIFSITEKKRRHNQAKWGS